MPTISQRHLTLAATRSWHGSRGGPSQYFPGVLPRLQRWPGNRTLRAQETCLSWVACTPGLEEGLRGAERAGLDPRSPSSAESVFPATEKSNIYRAGPSQEFPHWPQLRVTLSWVPGTAPASRPAATPERPVTKRQPRAHQVWLRVSRDGATNTLDTALRQGHRDATIATRCPLEG